MDSLLTRMSVKKLGIENKMFFVVGRQTAILKYKQMTTVTGILDMSTHHNATDIKYNWYQVTYCLSKSLMCQTLRTASMFQRTRPKVQSCKSVERDAKVN